MEKTLSANIRPIMLLVLRVTYYAQSNASILWKGLASVYRCVNVLEYIVCKYFSESSLYLLHAFILPVY